MILKKKIAAFLFRLISVISILNFISCNSLTEPEPFVNGNVIPQEIKPLSLPGYQMGDTVKGSIIIELEPSAQLSEINYITVLNDSFYFPKILQPPFKFDVDTRWWSNGNHELSVGLYKKEYNIGLLRLINEPSVKYTIPLVFCHPPLVPNVYGFLEFYYNPDTDTVYTDTNIRWEQDMINDVKYFIVQISVLHTPVVSDTIYSTTIKEHNKRIYYEHVESFRVGAGNEYGVTYTRWTQFY